MDGAPGRRLARAVAAGLLLTAIGWATGGDAHAQTRVAQTEDPAEGAQEDLEALRQEEAGARTAEEAVLGRDCPNVSFAQILADPDNALLNGCYAIQQIERGDLQGAAATLERVLIVQPGQAEVRLLYAIVLYRLENLIEAEREFRAVQALPLRPDDARRIQGYLDRIAKRRQRTTHTVTVSLGGHYDSNRNAAPRGEEALVLGVPTDLTLEADRANDDTAVMGLVRYEIDHDLGQPREHRAIGSLTLFQDDQTERDELDLQSLLLNGGFVFDLPDGWSITPTGAYSAMTLSRERFYTSYGGAVRIDKRVRRPGRQAPLDLWVSLGKVRERFRNISENRSLADRDGTRVDALVGMGMWLAPAHRLSLEASQTYKEAQRRYQGYRFWKGAVRHTWLLGDGRFLASSASYGVRLYRAPDPLVTAAAAPQRRREHPLRLRTTIGAPAGGLLDAMGYAVKGETTGAVRDFLDDVMVTATAEYLKQQSNIRNYDYDNLRGQFLVTKRYEF